MCDIPGSARVTLGGLRGNGQDVGRFSGKALTIYGVYMFESDESVVEALVSQSAEFKELYKRYNELKNKVNKAGSGTLAIGDVRLTSMKREKLQLKDRMTAMIDEYRRKHTS